MTKAARVLELTLILHSRGVAGPAAAGVFALTQGLGGRHRHDLALSKQFREKALVPLSPPGWGSAGGHLSEALLALWEQKSCPSLSWLPNSPPPIPHLPPPLPPSPPSSHPLSPSSNHPPPLPRSSPPPNPLPPPPSSSHPPPTPTPFSPPKAQRCNMSHRDRCLSLALSFKKKNNEETKPRKRGGWGELSLCSQEILYQQIELPPPR